MEYMGNTYKYTTAGDLARLLNISVMTAERYIADSRKQDDLNSIPVGRRLLLTGNADGTVRMHPFNVKDDFTGLLRRYGVTRIAIPRENILNPQKDGAPGFVPQQGIPAEIVEHVPGAERVQVYVKIKMLLIANSDTEILDDVNMNNIFHEHGLVNDNQQRGRGRRINNDIVDLYKNAGVTTRTTERVFLTTPDQLDSDILSANFEHARREDMNDVLRAMRELGPMRVQNQFWTGAIADYLKNTPFHLIDYDYQVYTTGENGQRLYYVDQQLRAPQYYRLEDWTKVEYSKAEGPDNCVVNYISNTYRGLKSKILDLARSPITVKRFQGFMEKNFISYNIYDVKGNLKATHTTDKHQSIGTLSMIVYNNHVYPIGNLSPVYAKSTYTKIEVVDNITDKLIRLIKKGIVPKKIKVSNTRQVTDLDDIPIRSYIHNKVKYIGNPEYKRCLEIAKCLGPNFEELITDETTVADLPKIIMRATECKTSLSFMPDGAAYRSPACLWKTQKPIRVDDVTTIDKNKCYSYILSNIQCLIVFDYRRDPINDLRINGEGVSTYQFIDTHLYLATPEAWSILLPCTKLYTGSFLRRCAERGFKFTVAEELVTRVEHSPYPRVIGMMQEMIQNNLLTWEEFKFIINVTIGKMESTCKKSVVKCFSGIFETEAANHQPSCLAKLTKDYSLGFDVEEKYINVRNRFPTSIQVKDEARMMIYDKIVELGLSDSDIVQINTDSISYYGTLPKDLDPVNFASWKQSKFNEIYVNSEVYDIDCSALKPYPISSRAKRILHMKYAGAGKTHEIVNKLVPRLIKQNKSYIVLTPTHRTLEEYKRHGINCDVIQTYVFSGEIPTEDYVIVDEIGFLGPECHDVLYKIAFDGKHLECYGDFSQLAPPGTDGTYDQLHYLEYFFTEIDRTFTNHRNGFTTDYYDSLINSDDTKWLISEVNSYSTPSYKDAERVICYRHSTCAKYNEKMLKHLGFERRYDRGALIMCTNNKLLEHGICNRMEFIVRNVDYDDNGYIDLDGEVTLKEINTNTKYTIPAKAFMRGKFESAYAINVHQIQGSTMDSYHWAKEDNAYISGRVAYVVISRLRS